ncbi:tRNA-cytidine(32) 2-sulfurtransferase [Nymphon striatum]|nr:tRNA-cytidine(32) 2-sulfurtransferase [Nymphon striatum]
MSTTATNWSESEYDKQDSKQHASRKFYDLPDDGTSKRTFPVKKQLDPEALFSYLENNIIGRNYQFSGPFGVRNVLYCDYTASGRSLQFIENYISNEVLPAYGNTHTTTSVTSLQTTLFRHEARDIIRNAVNASEYDAVIFVGNGATGGIHKLIHAMNPQRPIVFVGPFEHHSNLLPWREISSFVIRIPETSHGLVDAHILEKNLLEYKAYGRQMIGCFSAASNITGTITNVDEISSLLHKHDALALWDYASAAPYLKIDMNPVIFGENQGLAYKDAVFISTHKFLGGVGTPGILVAKKSLFHNPVPYESGGGTIFFVSRESHRYLQDVEAREEGGTPDIVGAVRAGLVFQMKEAISNDVILKKDESNISKAMKIWKKVDNLIILGNTDVPKLPIFSFLILHKQSGLFLHHNFVAAVLNDVFGIQCRGGCACAGPYALDLLGINEQLAEQIENHLVEDSRLDRIHLRRKGEYSHREVLRPGFVRLNLPFFMNGESLDFIINAVKLVCEHAWKLLPLYIVNPETGEWKHHSHQVMKDRKWLGSLSYNEGKFSYPVHLESESQSSLNHQECLLQAEQIFANAENISLKIKLYDQSVIFDASSDKLRSFILPSEAQAYLRNEIPEINPSLFFPKSYLFSENVHQFQGSANQRDLFIKSSLSIPGKVDGIGNEDSVNTLMTEILSHLKNMKSDALNVANDKLVIDNNLKERQNTSVGDKERIDKFSNKISVIEKALNEIRETILKENYELRAKLDNRTQKEFINSDHDRVKGVLNQDAVSLKAKKTKKEKKKLWHYPPKSILKPTLKVFLLCEYSYYVCGFCDKNMWPSSSPDISPMDFAIWSILKSDIFAKSYSSITALKEALLASWSTFDEEVVRISCHSVTSRLEAIEDFDMIKNHDRLLVCLSGGKDSLSLLHMIKQYQFIAQKKGIMFSLGAVTVDPQTESYNPSSLKEYLAKLNVPYFYEEQCIIEQAATLPEQCTSICSFCSRMKRGRIYACARREGYNVLALGQHLDDLTESFMMSVFHNGRLGTMKANYTVKEGDLRVIRPFVFVREEALRNFAIESRLPVIAENCPACFEAPKERHRMKQLLAAQEVIFPRLYSSLKSAILPIMSINRTGIDGRHLYSKNNDDSDD